MQRIAAREDVGLHVRARAEEAQLVRFGQSCAIIINAGLPPPGTLTGLRTSSRTSGCTSIGGKAGIPQCSTSGGSMATIREIDGESLCTLLMQGPEFTRLF